MLVAIQSFTHAKDHEKWTIVGSMARSIRQCCELWHRARVQYPIPFNCTKWNCVCVHKMRIQNLHRTMHCTSMYLVYSIKLMFTVNTKHKRKIKKKCDTKTMNFVFIVYIYIFLHSGSILHSFASVINNRHLFGDVRSMYLLLGHNCTRYQPHVGNMQ